MSIRTRLLLIALMATLAAALFLASRFVGDRDSRIAAATQRVPAQAARVADLLSDRIRGTEQLHFGLSRARDLDSSDRPACSAFLSQVRDKYPQYTGILTIKPDGQLFCDSLRTGRTLDLNDRAYFRKAKASTGAIALQSAFGRLTGIAVLQIAYPVRDEQGSLKSVLLASLNLERLAQGPMKEMLNPGSQVMLADLDGLVLATSGTMPGVARAGSSIAGSDLFRFAIAREQGAGEIVDERGDVQTWAVADGPLLRDAGILVLIGESKDELLAAAKWRFAQDLAALAGASTILLLALFTFAELGIRRHIVTIAGMVEKLGRNEPKARIAEPHPSGELGVLMSVLNRSAALQEQQRESIADLNSKLRESQRLEAMGQLTGGVAHDFNNLLTVILGNAEVLQELLADNKPLASHAAMVVHAAERGAELTQRLLAFARRQALVPQAVDVNRLIAGMDGMLKRTLGEDIEIRIAFADDLGPAQIDPGQLENALLNLCVNARDAMPQGGRLTIETASKDLGSEDAGRYPDLIPGQFVMLAVSDTGQGISAEDLERVFEPFFTTKEVGKGTGLGLAMIYGFVKQSGGHVNIHSEPGKGTTVELYLPRAANAVAEVEAAAMSGQVVGGSEVILLVEDDALVRRYAHDQLVALGYCVIEASGGAPALDILRSGQVIDVLFTDVVMPGMSGRELANEATKLRPSLKVLFTSGYAESVIVHQGRLDPGVQLLGKPYHRDELARRIRAVLAAPAAAPSTMA